MPHQDDDAAPTGGSPSTPPAKPWEPLHPSRNEIGKGEPGEPGGEMDLVSLAPQYAQEQHGLYLNLLERAINHRDTRNVALTGTFGAGKSSVLKPLKDSERARKTKKNSEFTGNGTWRKHTVTTLSLSTLGPDTGPQPDAKNAARREPSNRIQKELVKQLLYQLPAGRAPRSRFRRLVHPRPLRRVAAAVLALALALAIMGVVATLAGWVGDSTGWRIASLLTIVAALTVCFFTVWWLAGDRLNLQAGFNAGPATVRLDPRSTSYFDQYLDEIMYFFQVSKTDVVLIEDLDRFEDIAVFDTLRALNDLVNESGGIGRRVVFVYAVSDSILSRIGDKKPASKDGKKDDPIADPVREKRALALGNQTKFFDVIIPIVPFISTANARDLLMQVMEPEKTEISPALIRLAARHVSDMRLMWSIRNEYEVHANRLLDKTRIMPGNTPDIVFALVLLRATVPADYEKIQLTRSTLDTLHKRWRDLVNENIQELTRELGSLRRQLEDEQSPEMKAKQAGDRLNANRLVFAGLEPAKDVYRVEFMGPVQEGQLYSVEGWTQIAHGSPLTIELTHRDQWNSFKTTRVIGASLLTRLLDIDLSSEAWNDFDAEYLNKEIAHIESDIHFLRYHSWSSLCQRSTFTVDRRDGESLPKPNEADANMGPERKNALSFNDLVEHYAPSTLAKELIRGGYLPFDFASYEAIYYGGVVNPEAYDYIRRNIEEGNHDVNFSLTDESVEQILREQDAENDGADLFSDPVLYNIDIVDYLLRKRPKAAQRVATRLTTWGEAELEFVNAFFGQPHEPDREYADVAQLARLMAPTWTQAVHYAAVDAPVDPATRLRLVDAVLDAVPDGPREDLDEDVAAFFSEHYAELDSYERPASKAKAEHAVRIAAKSGAAFQDLSPLNKMARTAAAEQKIYPVTATNLTALAGEDVALDTLRKQKTMKPVYEHALDNLADYLDALCTLDPPTSPVKDPKAFANIITAVADEPRGLVDHLVGLTPSECRVEALSDADEGVPKAVWPILISRGRTGSTYENVRAYVGEYDVDEELGAFLMDSREIVTPEDTEDKARVDLAVAILSARESIPDPGIRVELAGTLEPEGIPIDRIEDQDGCLIGPLLTANLLPDEPSTFEHRRLTRWDDFKAAVAASNQFAEFADASLLSAEFLAKVLDTSSGVNRPVRTALAAKVAEIVSPSSNDVEPCEPVRAHDATEIAQFIRSGRYPADRVTITALCAAYADATVIVRLVAAHNELSTDDLKAILRSLGGEYARVANGGSGKPAFLYHPELASVLDRLKGDTHNGVKPTTTKRGSKMLAVNLKRPR
jgi:hypothetical protein